jgi:hypothetical protein
LEFLKQTLVWSPGQGEQDEVVGRARDVFNEFEHWGGDKALICVGSMKSNPVVELVVAEAFGCEPFESQDGIPLAQERLCPFYFRLRESDPRPGSCCGGFQLSSDTKHDEPGIYYEMAKGEWEHCPWTEEERDAALVFYVHRESQGRLEMVLSGFSGRSTRMLAKTLATRAEDFWPPNYDGQGIQMGAFIVQYQFPSADRSTRDILSTDLVANTKIIKLSEAAIQRRLVHPLGK